METSNIQSNFDPDQSVVDCLTQICNETPNDQILSYKVRIFVEKLNNGEITNPQDIIFTN